MEDPKICAYRTSMKYNSILEKPDIGHQKKPICCLPPSDFTYGTPRPQSSGTVKEALQDWYNARKKINLRTKEHLGEDLILPYSRIKLNRIPDKTYGYKSGTSEDINAILCNAYHHKFVDDMKHRELKRREKIKERIDQMARSRQVIIRVRTEEVEDTSPLWKMKKFSNVKAKVSSHRT